MASWMRSAGNSDCKSSKALISSPRISEWCRLYCWYITLSPSRRTIFTVVEPIFKLLLDEAGGLRMHFTFFYSLFHSLEDVLSSPGVTDHSGEGTTSLVLSSSRAGVIGSPDCSGSV